MESENKLTANRSDLWLLEQRAKVRYRGGVEELDEGSQNTQDK